MIAVVAFAVFGFTQISAQNADAKITLTKIVETSADDVWAELRKLDNIDKISSFVGKVEFTGPKGIGGSRVCIAPDGQGKFKENIIAFDDAARSYSYAVVEGVPATGMVNNFKVVDLGYQKSMIVWTGNYDAFVENPQMTEEQFSGFLNQACSEMMANVALAATK